jgi:hypothetical protein
MRLFRRYQRRSCRLDALLQKRHETVAFQPRRHAHFKKEFSSAPIKHKINNKTDPKANQEGGKKLSYYFSHGRSPGSVANP